MEIERGVKENERLSKYLQVKHLYEKNVCVDLPQPRKEHIEKMAAELGAKIQSDVVNDSYLISTNKHTEKVAKAMNASNVKVLIPEFIE